MPKFNFMVWALKNIGLMTLGACILGATAQFGMTMKDMQNAVVTSGNKVEELSVCQAKMTQMMPPTMAQLRSSRIVGQAVRKALHHPLPQRKPPVPVASMDGGIHVAGR